MVIQRIQSLFLFIAAVVMAVLCFCVPVATLHTVPEPTTLYVKDFGVMIVINLLITALLVISIFLYKNLKLQMKITLLTIVLIAVSMVTCGFVLGARLTDDAEVIWLGATILILVVLAMAIAAYGGMRKDRNLLRSYDRLR